MAGSHYLERIPNIPPLSQSITAKPSWYDYPQYYDLGFREDTQREACFFEQVFERHVDGPVRRLLEPGCGSGRLVVEMAARGYQVTGFDLNNKAIRYCQNRLKRRHLEADLRMLDMADFSIDGKPYDAAFNTFNTFRHLLTEDQAQSHLERVAQHVRVGGVYILGFHLLPSDCDLMSVERWSASHRKVKINYTLSVIRASRAKRREDLRIRMNVTTPKGKTRLEDIFSLRLYTAQQFRSLLAKVPAWQIASVHDFWYEIDEPQVFDNELIDALFLLKRV